MNDKKKKKSVVEVTPKCYANIQVTYTNTIITITNMQGETITSCSAGRKGFSGKKKNTPYAATQTALTCAEDALKKGVKTIIAKIKGAGAARYAAVKGLGKAGLKVTAIQDKTPLPHNGCRPAKKRHL